MAEADGLTVNNTKICMSFPSTDPSAADLLTLFNAALLPLHCRATQDARFAVITYNPDMFRLIEGGTVMDARALCTDMGLPLTAAVYHVDGQ